MNNRGQCSIGEDARRASVYLTLGTQGSSLIVKVEAGSTLDASLVTDVIDSLEPSEDDDTSVLASSSVDVPPPVPALLEPSSLAASESRADCLVKLYSMSKCSIMSTIVFVRT